MNNEKTDSDNELQTIITSLIECGLTPSEIAKRSGNRVSRRTIYRWMSGECAPKQQHNIEVLKRLLHSLPPPRAADV